MVLIEKNNTGNNWNELNRIYINTLIPYFRFKNKNGSIIIPRKCCIAL